MPFVNQSISFSSLSNRSDPRIKAPAQLSAPLHLGLRIEKKMGQKPGSLDLHLSYFSTDLSVATKIQFNETNRAELVSNSVNFAFDVIELGVKRQIFNKGRTNFGIETGFRVLINRKTNKQISFKGSSTFLSEQLTWNTSLAHSSKMAALPYIGANVGFKVGKVKLGAIVWFQYRLRDVLKYQLQVDYGSYSYSSSLKTNGTAGGISLYMNVLTF